MLAKAMVWDEDLDVAAVDAKIAKLPREGTMLRTVVTSPPAVPDAAVL